MADEIINYLKPIDPEKRSELRRAAIARFDEQAEQEAMQAENASPDFLDIAEGNQELADFLQRDYEEYTGQAVQVPNRFTYIKASAAEPNLDSSDFVQGLLEDSKISVVYGPSNCGKTFFVTDLCLHVSMGWEWRNKRVEQRNVMYVAMEGASGLKNRLAAFKQRYECQPDKFVFVPHTVDLLDPDADIPEFIKLIEAAALDIGDIRWIVIDTLARAIAGGDENSGEDMGRLIRHADKLQKLPSAPHVTLIHHSGKDQAKGARGWSGLRAAIDTEIEINREPEADYSTVKAVKQRDLPMDFDAAFILERQVLGKNRYEEEVSSCTVQVWEVRVKDKKAKAKLTPNQKFVFDAILAEALVSGIPQESLKNGRRMVQITYEAFRERMEQNGSRTFFDEGGNEDKIKSATQTARNGLKDKGLINFDRNHIEVFEEHINVKE